jgi:transcriptional regulator with GAF, ATPase, and Fis domain
MMSAQAIAIDRPLQPIAQGEDGVYFVGYLKSLERDRQGRNQFEGIVGVSPALRAVLEQVRTVGPTNSTVLIEGETGTGKELIANAIHAHSNRGKRPIC